jgi:hypothetical protein
MNNTKFWRLGFLVFALASMLLALGSAQGQVTRQISASGTTALQSQAPGGDGIQSPEIDDLAQDAGQVSDDSGDTGIDRILPTAQPGNGASVNGGKKAKSNPQLNLSYDGLNFRQQRLANHGNQFSVEPPDQGLCAGNGFVLESTNDVLTVFDTAGNQVAGVTDLNSFYNYAPAIARGRPNQFGPSVTDPSCIFDAGSQRWFHVVLTLDRIKVDPSTGLSTSQALSGRNHLDIAVSDTSSPLGSWTVYTIPVQDDGTEGTPNHNCNPGGTPSGRTHPNACLGDYPHIGADANGFYVTTNEFSLFAAGFNAAQIYAFSKGGLVGNPGSVTMVQYDTSQTPAGGLPGFTVWPAVVPSTLYDSDNGGTEFFQSSFAVFTGIDNRLALWSLTNTQALNSGGMPTLSNRIVGTELYANAPRASQPGSGTNDSTKNWPLGQCLNDATCDLFLEGAPPQSEKIGKVNGNDSRIQQVMYANGKLWSALDTGISTDGGASVHSGVAYFVLNPNSAKVVLQGYVALSDASLLFPTTAVTDGGRGVLSFTIVGPDTDAGVAYSSLDAIVGAGDVHVAQTGAGLQDGFTEYPDFFGGRPRWGDYGGAAVDGNSIWFAAEYINQSCDLGTYESGFNVSIFGSCGGTRASLGNWATRISRVTP